ncbi:hypothetical protein [Rhodococcus ruber]|uniref:hypothetical protein n=1 Tax=Rhodococcus ruber TaxID=1830 RepID=UPI000E6B3C77|nr:hypothetical protein [Rhodococcus ruber]
MHIAGHLSPEEFWRRIDAGDEQVRGSVGAFPLYGLHGWTGPVMLGKWQWENGQVTTAGLVYGTPATEVSVEVVTTVHDPRRRAVTAIERAVGVSPADARCAGHHHRIARAAAREVQIRVDGRDLIFSAWGGSERWWPAGTVEGAGIVVQARRYPPDRVVLVAVHDVEPYLSGRRAYLLTVRGGV